MPVMTKMRDNMPTILIMLVVAFLVMIVFEWGMDYTRNTSHGRDYIGKINDRKISYQEFSELVKQRAENEKAQAGKEPDEQKLAQIRDEVWTNLVNQALIDEEIQRLKIIVPDQELIDWVKGDNPPEFLKRQFMDSTGTFNRAAYESAINDPRNKKIWIQIESGLKKQRMQEKLQSILLSGVRINENEILQRFIDQNIRYNADYIFFDPNKFVTDNEAKVTDAEIEKYYNEHSSEYKVEATRKLKFVKFLEVPSAKDSVSILSEMDDLLKKAKEGTDFKELVSTYSEVPLSDVFYKMGDLSPQKEELVFNAAIGSIVGPYLDNNGYHITKVLEQRDGDQENIKASHILINVQGSDSVKSLNEAKDILNRIKKGADFSELAKKYSQDPGSGVKGGDIGWFSKGRMVKPFEEACQKAKIGQVVGPVRTQFGYHIIKVTGKSKRELKIADIVSSIKASSQTRGDISQAAQDFRYLAKENDFIKEAEIAKYQVQETPAFTENGIVPGIGNNRSVSKFAFEGKVGDLSEVFSLGDGYAVFIITESKKEGIRPLSEIKDALKPRVQREKKMQLLKAKVEIIRYASSSSDSLKKISSKNPDLSVQNTGIFTLAGSIPGIGHDQLLFGKLPSLKIGETSKPIEGNRGYYIFRLTEKGNFDPSIYKSQREMLTNQLLQSKKNQFLSDWIEQLKKKADIEDNRDLYFR
jgi:peptidyl-prolyl cis-trans isomerase D